MSPPWRGLNPTNPILPQPPKTVRLHQKDLPAGLPEQNRKLTELQNEVRRLVSAHLIHRSRDLLYYSAPSEVDGLLAEFAGHVARVIGIPGEPACRHVGDRRRVATGWCIQQRERHRPRRARGGLTPTPPTGLRGRRQNARPAPAHSRGPPPAARLSGRSRGVASLRSLKACCSLPSLGHSRRHVEMTTTAHPGARDARHRMVRG